MFTKLLANYFNRPAKKTSSKNENAILSDIAYEKQSNVKSARAKELGYTVDDQLSNQYETVFHKDGKNPVIAYRGTQLDMNDIRADRDLIHNRLHQSTRYQHAQATTDSVKKKYGNTIRITGHSLGGSIADEISSRNTDLNLSGEIFNPGSNAFKQKTASKNISVIRNSGDIISAGYRDAKIQGNHLSPLDAHGITQFG